MRLLSPLHFASYLCVRALLFPFSLLPYSTLHKVGKGLGILTFPLLTRYRKRALSNLAIASSLALSNEDIVSLAKESLGNLFITAFEYGKLSKEKDIFSIVTCKNPETASGILKTGKGIIFFCAHLANWEVLFLEGTARMKGIAIGQPIANNFLYDWITDMRQSQGGKMIEPKQAVKEGLKALKKGIFMGIVGDQSLPVGGFSSSFLGRPAFTSPLPSLLSHRSDSPIIVATTIRENGKYYIQYSEPLWPDQEKSMEEDIPRLMNSALDLMQASIRKHPGQWLWQHNKWKQQGPGRLKKRYRHDTMAVFLPLNGMDVQELVVLREIYPTEFISFFVPHGTVLPDGLASETHFYKETSELKKTDYRFKLIFNFTSDLSLNRHFLKLAAFEALTRENIAHLSKDPNASFSSQLKQVILHAS